MNTKNNYLIIAGFLNLFTALLHLIGGQLDLINPLLESNLTTQVQTEMLGVWHMVTIFLFASSYTFLRGGFNIKNSSNEKLHLFISYLYIAFSFAFIITSLFKMTLAPQWILLLPIGVLGIIGVKKSSKTNALESSK